MPTSDYLGYLNGHSGDVPNTLKYVEITGDQDIPSKAFENCRDLENIVIRGNVKKINESTFSGCNSLKSITLPDGAASVGKYAFKDCRGLTNVTIPGGVKDIGDFAFQNCTSTHIFFFKGSAPSVGTSVFDTVKSGAIGIYTAAHKAEWEAVIDANGYWHGLKMKMEGAPDSYKVMFDKNGGDSVSVESLTRDDGAAIGTLPTATREGYDFVGWFTASAGGTKISGSTVVTGNVTYYAHWTQRKPVTYTIIYNVTEGEGSVASQTCEFGEEVYVDDGGTLHWEGHYFRGWAFAPDGDVAYRAGDTVAEPTNGDSVTLYAKWLPELTLEPMLADWSEGSITLLLGNAAELRGKKYSIWCKRGGDSNAQWWEITDDEYISTEWLDGEKLEIKDVAFYARYDAIQPVEYRVIDEYGRKAECMTRVKYAIAVGLDKYDPSMGCEDLPGMEAYAETFTNLAIRAGAFKEQVIALTGRRANLDNLNTMFKYIRDNAKPGDVCLLYFGTHGGHDESTGYNLALYNERYSVQRAFEHISALGEGVAVVGFVHACGSGGFTIGDQWMQNVAWITATDSPHIYTVDTHFSRFLLDYGWQGGWAGMSGKPLTFGQLADYMGKSYDKFFSGLVLDGNMGEIKAKVCNKELLGKIGAGICASHSGDKPAAFTVNASKNNPYAVVLDGFSIQKSTHVAVFKRFAGQEKFSLSLGGPELVLFDKNLDNIARIEADRDPKAGQHSSPSNPMEFIVKAYNGAGVTAADLVQGWRAAMAAQTEDGRTWNYVKVDGGVSIVSAEESSASLAGLKGAVTIPSILEGMPVVSINALAFEGCDAVTSVSIPDSVTSIGDGAFEGCTGLTSIAIPNSVTSIGDSAFSGCSSLTSVTIPNSVTTIGDGAFSWCEGLTSVTIGSGVKRIGEFTFSGCYNLTGIVLPDSVEYVGDEAFSYCEELIRIVFGKGLTEIDEGAFSGCTALKAMVFTGDAPSVLDTYYDDGFVDINPKCVIYVRKDSINWGMDIPGTWSGLRIEYLDEEPGSLVEFTIEDGVLTAVNLNGATEVKIPSSVTSIGDWAFAGCSGLTDVTIPSSVTTIGNAAFYGCSGLTSVTIPDSVTSIGYAAFGCSGLTSVTIPDSVSSIGYGAFMECGGLMSFVVFEGNANYKSVNGLLLTKDGETLVAGVNGDVIIPDGVTTIGESAFDGYSDLTSVTIPSSVTTIEEFAFYGCVSLTCVDIPDSVESVGDGAFCGCDGIVDSDGFIIIRNVLHGYSGDDSEVHIPECVTRIGDDAFYESASLKSVTIPDSVTSIGSDAFYLCTALTSVAIPDSVTSIGDGAFGNCIRLSSVTIGNSVACIGEMAFFGSSLTSVAIPSSVTSIGDGAFSACRGLTSVIFEGEAPEVSDVTFISVSRYCVLYVSKGWDVAIPGTWNGLRIEYIEDKASSGTPIFTIEDGVLASVDLNGATGVMIPDGVTSIGSDAFYGCSGLASVTIPDSVTSIGSQAFYLCAGLTGVTIPDSVTSIGFGAFGDCSRLSSVTIGNSVACIEDCAFFRCSRLTAFIVGEGNAYYTSVSGLLLSKDGKTLIAGVNGVVTIPDSVTSIGSYAFSWCSGLTSVTIGNSVTSIGFAAFEGCGGLASVTIPNSVKSIGSQAFYGCVGLTSVTIPDSVTSIGDVAFGNCSDLTNVIFSGNAPTIGGDAFRSVASSCAVYVRKDSTGWGVDIPGTWQGMRIEYLDVVEANGEAVEFEMSTDGKTRTATVAVGTAAEDVKVFVGGVDVTKGFKVEVVGTTATVALKNPFEMPREEVGSGNVDNSAWTDNGDGNVTLNVEIVPGLYYAADSAATIEALKRPGAAVPANAGDAVVAPKQEGVQGFYKVWVSDAPIEAE